jgi:hypothetical protein
LFVLNWFSDQNKIPGSSQKTPNKSEKRDEWGNAENLLGCVKKE